MADKSKIEWTDATWNPIRGCSRVSEGCRNCYAEKVAARFSGEGQPYAGLARRTSDGGRWTSEVSFIEKHLEDPLRWKKPRRIFVNSMSDLFHDGVSNEQIAAVFGVMLGASWHTFQILTKRPQRMLEWFKWIDSDENYYPLELIENAALKYVDGCHLGADTGRWSLPNVWLGVSVENQQTADERIPLLLQTPAAVRWLSCEPLLNKLVLPFDLIETTPDDGKPFYLHDKSCPSYCDFACGSEIKGGIDWVVVGGESGAGARPMHPAWVRSLRDQCVSANVPFFFKQWGEYGMFQQGNKETMASITHDGISTVRTEQPRSFDMFGTKDVPPLATMYRVGKKLAGRTLDGQIWDEYPEV